MPTIAMEGRYKLRPYRWELRNSGKVESQSIGLRIEFLAMAVWDVTQKAWRPLVNQTVDGTFYLVKRDGTPNEGQIENLKETFGWDGNIDSLFGDTPVALPDCEGHVEAHEYAGRIFYRVDWVGESRTRRGKTNTADLMSKCRVALSGGTIMEDGSTIPF